MVGLHAVISTLFVAQAAGIGGIARSANRARNIEVKETHAPPRRWTRLDRAPKDHVIHLQIGIKQSNFAELERHLYEGMIPIWFFGTSRRGRNWGE